MRRSCLLVIGIWVVVGRAGAAAEPPASFREAVEEDWLLQDKVRTRGAATAAEPVTTQQDALGAVDGVKDGKWGFHTLADPSPWWQVDLGERVALDRVVVYNRCDHGCAARNPLTELRLSDDGKVWATVYSHKGKPPFGGVGYGEPLAVKLEGKAARFVRLQHPTSTYFHLDEVEVYATADPKANIARGRAANQSSVSQWSVAHDAARAGLADATHPFDLVLDRGRKLVADLVASGADVGPLAEQLEAVAERVKALPDPNAAFAASAATRRALYLELRWAVRRIALANPVLDFGPILFVKRKPGTFSHMSDQHYGWFSRPGGGLFVLTGWRDDADPAHAGSDGSLPWRQTAERATVGPLASGEPAVRDITPDLPQGSFLSPELSHDGQRVLFAWCRYYPHLNGLADKTNKPALPDDGLYHIYEMNLDGSGLRQLTRGRYDDLDARYLPDGRIAFLSTRRGQFVQCGRASAAATVADPCLPDSYVRCGGGRSRPVAVYTLHVMDADGSNLRCISPFENFEWTPSVASDGRILFARWDYVDRHNMPFMSLWAVHPDGSFPNLVYGNFTHKPHCVFETRAIPGSRRLLFTASAHHAFTGGSICRLDPAVGTEADEPVTRLTPEVCFPEIEGWAATYYAHPYPLSERHYLVSWSPVPMRNWPKNEDLGATFNETNCLGLYLADAFGNLELLYRDPAISSCSPLPLRPRPRPHALPDLADDGAEGRFLLLDVYRGLGGIPEGAVKRLRIVAVPAKTQPEMNSPAIGATRDDPGKCVLGTVPVEADGSAHFRVPAGVIVFFQALDADGMAIQTMRTVTSVQPGMTAGCIGCHERRNESPPNTLALAATREPSPITPGPEGSWPLRYDRLVQPVLDKHCVRCHSPQGKAQAVRKLDLTPAKSYAALANYASAPIRVQRNWRPGRAPGRSKLVPVVAQTSALSLHAHVRQRYGESRSTPGACAAATNPVIARLRQGHQDLELSVEDLERLVTWMDTYGQRQGHFSPEQERALLALRRRVAPLLAQRGP